MGHRPKARFKPTLAEFSPHKLALVQIYMAREYSPRGSITTANLLLDWFGFEQTNKIVGHSR